MIIEVVQAQPSAFGVGYCSGRIWTNGVPSSRKYLTDFSTDVYLFHDTDNVEANLCSRRNNGLPTPVYFGRYDLMNFIWFKGAEGLYVPDPSKIRSDKISLLISLFRI